MKDVQNQTDSRGVEIQKVGIKNFELPIVIQRKDADNNMYIDMYIVSNNKATYAQSNAIPFPSDSEMVYILLRNINGWYDVQLSNTLG